ncbi:MAG: glycosyltransferase family 4 protein [Chloroflexi bacterium]|nr:glycosyltransferase family 4 protein [Chloroflexota bacterium]
MRILFIARYRDPSMHRKVQWMAQQPGVTIRAIYPNLWQDELVRVEQRAADEVGLERRVLPMFGSPADPHRAFYRSLAFGMAGFRPQIVHAEEEPDSLAALQIALCRRLWAPQARLLLHTWQNLDRPLSRPVRWVLARTLSAADGIFCANREAVDLLRRRGYSRSTPLIPAIGVDTELFTPRQPKRSGPFVVGYVGRLVAEKGIDTLIDAVRLVSTGSTGAREKLPRPLRLRIIGAGPYESHLRHRMDEADLTGTVEFLPPVSPSQIARQMAKLDALVLPSRTTPVWKEQLGRVLLEAMAVGVPVIGADSGAIPEVIGDAGLIFPEGEASALAERLRRLLSDPLLTADLTRRGLERAEQEYSQRVLAARTVDFYRQVVQ